MSFDYLPGEAVKATSAGLARVFWSRGRWVTAEARVCEGLMLCATSGFLHSGIIQTEPATAAGPHAPHLLQEKERCLNYKSSHHKLNLLSLQIESNHLSPKRKRKYFFKKQTGLLESIPLEVNQQHGKVFPASVRVADKLSAGVIWLKKQDFHHLFKGCVQSKPQELCNTPTRMTLYPSLSLTHTLPISLKAK